MCDDAQTELPQQIKSLHNKALLHVYKYETAAVMSVAR